MAASSCVRESNDSWTIYPLYARPGRADHRGMSTICSPLPRATPAPHGALLLSAAGVLLGTIGLFLERAGAHPLTAVWFRSLFGLLALSGWMLATRRVNELRLAPRALGAALAAGTLMVTSWALFFAALEHTGIALATVVVHVQPFWVMLLGVLLLHEHVTLRQGLAAGVALLGLALASGLAAAADVAAGAGTAIGVVLCLASSLCYAGVTLFARRAHGASPLVLAWWQCAVGTVALVWWPFVHGWPAGAAWGWLAGLGVVHTGLAYVLWYGGVVRLSAGRLAALQFVYPATAVLVDALVYGRRLDALQWAGVLLMAVGLVAARRPQR